MAFNRNKVILYAVAGIILALTTITFIPTQTESHITTSISLEQISGYGIQIIKISEDNSQITHLVINIQSIEARIQDGEWVKVFSRTQLWDLLQETEKIFTIDMNLTGYSKIRLNIAPDNNTVTLRDGREIQLSVSSLPLEVDLIKLYDKNNLETELRLSLGQGTVSNYILPNLQIEITTNKLKAEIIDQ